jgi:hypothetical protein
MQTFFSGLVVGSVLTILIVLFVKIVTRLKHRDVEHKMLDSYLDDDLK